MRSVFILNISAFSVSFTRVEQWLRFTLIILTIIFTVVKTLKEREK
tara:strand:- start:90 stop:227 length:138 start_codon:yes stop_codon:yes gene_type:complete